MGSIRVSPDQMDAAAQRLEGQMTDWETQVNNIKNCVTQLDSMWEGLGNQSFNSIWTENVQQFNNLRQVMTQYQTAIRAAANKFRQADAQVAGIVKR